MFICGDTTGDKVKVYDTEQGIVELLDKDFVLSYADKLVNNPYGTSKLENKLFGKVLYCRNTEQNIDISLYLSYEFSVLYDKGTFYILYGDSNPFKRNLKYILMETDNWGFSIEVEAENKLYTLEKEFILDELQVKKYEVQKIMPSTPKLLYENPNFVKKLVKTKFFKEVSDMIMCDLLGVVMAG